VIHNFQGRAEVSQRGNTSDKIVERIFKARSIHSIQSSKSGKLRISAGISKLISSPMIGQYDTALVADKIKFNTAKIVEIKPRHESPKPPLESSLDLRPRSRIVPELPKQT
jgi:hypothetical protein